MKICGIDPGKSGYVVIIETDSKSAYKYKLKYDKENFLDNKDLIHIFNYHNVDLIALEKINAFGASDKMSKMTLFNMGFMYGQLYACVRQYPHKFIFPKTWQATMYEGVSKRLTSKDRSISAYNQMFPHDPLYKQNKKPNHNIVDALLLACYAANKYYGCPVRDWEFNN